MATGILVGIRYSGKGSILAAFWHCDFDQKDSYFIESVH